MTAKAFLNRCLYGFFAVAIGIVAVPLVMNKVSAAEMPSQTAASTQLPTLPAGTAELSFSEFFKNPVGPVGLEPTEKLLSLNNKRVRIVGFMAHEDDPSPGIFIVAGRPTNVAEKADGMADDLPAATLSVYMPPEDQEKILTYRPGTWVLTGTLQLGNHEDSNGRISYARLMMDKKDLPADLPKTSHKKKTKQTAAK